MNIHELDSYQLSDAIKFHDRLNHRLWSNDEHLHPQVRDKLLEIAQDFQEFLGVPDLDVKDITISGSNAAYNYTNHSDIDLHLVVDLPSADSSEVYRELFDAKKYQYNDQHNIKIGGYSVELYVQNPNQEHHSQGIYSLLRNSWISVPKRKQAKIDDISTHSKYQDLSARINDAVTSSDFDRMHSLMAKIKHMRQSGLEQQGEFGSDNLAFKMLRANGLIEKLVTAKTAARDQQLSLQESMRPAPLPVQYGFAEDVSSNPSGVSASTKMFLETENDDEQTVHDFIMYTAKRLGIKHMPHIELHSDPKWSTREQSFGRYTPETHVLEVNLANRHIMDILRTTAHELVHCKQHQTKPLPDGAGKTGSPWENQANAQAGAIMRDYAQANPEKFGDHALGESSGYIPTPAQAKDKRFSTALSVDVHPGQTGREANKMSLQTDAQGRPALLISGLKNALHESKHSVAEGSLNEGLAHPIIVVDVQPEYSGMNDGDESSVFPQIINFVNKQTGPVLMFVNAEDQGLSGDTIPDIKQYWDDTICPEEERYIHDEETDEYIENSNCPRINWQRFAIADKGYGYFRSWMDHGIEPATIIATIRELYQQKKSDSRELQFPASNQRTPQQSLIMGAMQEMEDDPISVNWTSVAQLKRFNGAYIVGGARDQCLREVELLMNAFNIRYKRIDSLVYEGQQGMAEGSWANNNVMGHIAKNLTGQGSPIAKIRHKRDTEREKLGSISYGYRQDPNLKTTHKQVPFSEDGVKEAISNPEVKSWIEKVYDLYPQTFQNNHVMPLGGSGDDQQFAMFELVPSFSKQGAVEVKWFQAYPLRQGVGSRAMQELQRLAQEDGIALTLFPWDKGQVSQSKLMKFYKGAGFRPTVNGSKSLAWSPENMAEGLNENAVMAKIEQSGQIIRILKKAHTVPFSDEKNWLLVDVDPAKGNKGLGLKWIPANTRFEWVRPYRDTVDENFADGKKPGRKGLAKRSGVDCKQPVAKLRSIAANSSGERQRMAHWCANMKSGKKK